MVTINSIDDFNKFKDFPTQPLCYVYYKGSLLNSYYVGFTTQNGYKYLKNHHKMKNIITILNDGYSIQIYTKYNEKALIRFFKPILNKIDGTGKCGRNLSQGTLQCVGEVITMSRISKRFNRYKKRKIKDLTSMCDTIWDNLFKPENKSKYVSIHLDIVKYIVEKERDKDENRKYDELLNHQVFIKVIQESKRKKHTASILIKGLSYILKFCKITSLFTSFVIIHKVYLSHINQVIEDPDWYRLFHDFDNYKRIHNAIIKELKTNNCMITVHPDNIGSIICELSYFYRVAMIENFGNIN